MLMAASDSIAGCPIATLVRNNSHDPSAMRSYLRGVLMGKITQALISISAAALLASGSPAAAVPGGPPIAYAVNGGSTIDVYLSNADGSGKVKVYSTSSKHNLWQIDVRPGGNQLAL